MTDHRDSVLDNIDDIELITRMLNGQLDPDRVEAVRRRLEEDPLFRDLAAPLLLTWTVPRHLERKPRPAGELDRDWNEFTRRTGIGQSRPAPSRWRRGLRWLALVIFGMWALTIQLSDDASVVRERESSPVPYDLGWIPLGEPFSLIDVQLSPDATLRLAHRPVNDMLQVVLLAGTARFRISPFYATARAPRRTSLIVRTRGGHVSAGESEFTVTVSADTTDVQVHPLSRRGFLRSVQMTVIATTERQNVFHSHGLNDLDRARLMRGRRPHVVTDHP